MIPTEKSAILVENEVIEDSSIQFDQNYNYTSENVTNVSLLQEMSVNESVLELTLHKLASLILHEVPDYEQAMIHEIQTHIAMFLVDQVVLREAQLERKWAEIESRRIQSSSVPG